jgi:hypothetical protein
MGDSGKIFLIKLPYWIGIAADALWAVALFAPTVFGLLTGRPGFSPDLQVRLIMGIGGTLMAGWTCLLVWAVQDPVGRRVVILLTAFPVVSGLFLVALVGFLKGGLFNLWILCKTAFLFVTMITSYVLASSMVER